MSVVGTAKERPDRRTHGERENGLRWYRRVFLVTVDSKGDGGETVKSAAGIPARYAYYQTVTEANINAFCKTREAEQVDDTWRVWEVTCYYEETTAEEQNEDPRLNLPKMSYKPIKSTEPVVGVLSNSTSITPDDDDIYLEPIDNSAGDPYNPQPLMGTSRGLLVITRNEDSFNPKLAMRYEDAVNSNNWIGALPRQCSMSIECPGRESFTDDSGLHIYYPVTYTVEFRRDGHDLRLLDEGPHFTTSTSSTKKHAFIDADDQPYIGKLDGKGRSLMKVRGTTNSTLGSTVNAVYIRKPCPKMLSFAPLGLPETFI